jgi:hypothetical protein
MDDPGASANVHLRSWSYAKLGEREWEAVGAALRARGARLSVAFTPGWVDDGDPERGALEVGGRPVARRAGAVHPSPLVVHTDLDGNGPGRVNDYTSEFRGLLRLQGEGLIGVEQHGYTHMPADLRAWATAPDRYDDVAWYREFTPEGRARRAGRRHPVALGAAAIRRHFHRSPTTLVCPGQAWTEAALEQALAAGQRLVSAEGLALRDGERFCWCAGIPAVYLDKPDRALFARSCPSWGSSTTTSWRRTARLDVGAPRCLAAGRRAEVRRLPRAGGRARPAAVAGGRRWGQLAADRDPRRRTGAPPSAAGAAASAGRRTAVTGAGRCRRGGASGEGSALGDGRGRLIVPPS